MARDPRLTEGPGASKMQASRLERQRGGDRTALGGVADPAAGERFGRMPLGGPADRGSFFSDLKAQGRDQRDVVSRWS